MFKWLKSLFIRKPKEVCRYCNDTGEILLPVMQIGSMIEYAAIKCNCKKK